MTSPAARQRIAVLCPGFSAERRRRQPWHVADGLAQGFQALGHEALLLTDGPAEPALGLPYPVERLDSLLVRGAPSPALRACLARASCTRIFLITGASQLARLRRLDLGAPTALVMASPRLRLSELAALGPGALWRECRLLMLPLLNALLPGALLRAGFRRSAAAEMVYLSEAARERFAALGLPCGRLLRVGIDPAVLPPPPPEDAPFTVGYFGPPLALRGADLVLAAFEQATARGLDARLLLLLRSDAGRASLDHLLARVARSPVRERILCRHAMPPTADLRADLARCRAFLLPFRVTVSEAPLVVIEACLSGRPTIVLDAPGVGEYARALGGIVAASPARLADALLEAAHYPVRGVPDAAWTRWDAAAAALLEPSPPPFAAHRMVALAGVDGSGKTFILHALQARLDAAGIPHRHVWSRFRNYLSKPLLALARLTGHNRKEVSGSVRVGYHDFAGRPWLAWPFLLLQLLDQVLDIIWRYGVWRCRRAAAAPVILGDRCVYDTLVDLAVDTGLDDVIFGRIGRWLVRLLPAPRLVVVLTRERAAIAESRPDALLDRHFARRCTLYRRLAREFGLPVLDNNGPPAATLAALERLAAAGNG